ncbi:hypothetical protein [Hymenobacter saemangeumensis]|uniref:hypothetical protein n=1 Tax=Hymenobacter saemangeumensis TaxID=1084522 RepID=UPI0031EDE114
MTAARKLVYSREDFSDLMNKRLQALESKQEARQRYGTLLSVLRQQIDAYRSKTSAGPK